MEMIHLAGLRLANAGISVGVEILQEAEVQSS